MKQNLDLPIQTTRELLEQALPWLLEPESPGVRYLALRDLLDRPAGDPELQAAQALAHTAGPVATVLDAMEPAGYWVRLASGYNPKYRSAVWALILLAQLGASTACDERVERACQAYLEAALLPTGAFTATQTPAGAITCLQGNMCWSLLQLGCQDPRLDLAYDWMACSVTGERMDPGDEPRRARRYYDSGNSGPGFACGYTRVTPCAWGAVKIMLAFSVLPPARRTPVIERAIAQGIDYLLSVDPATAAYPSGKPGKPSRDWWKFGFPVFYITDLVQNLEALVQLGYGQDPRLANALALVRSKAGRDGRWNLEFDYPGKTWVDFGEKKQPNKWVTLRALRVLKQAGEPLVA